ncbi:hypothetical protein [Streptomyces pacificus]|uniref:Uncharacterized protein n=1 Tax=Streptomyces pacificus TaxID=2705029 RepID=A0A6A0ASK9_9ACTN|nr:hypothetical protein [Streptomyces pacificus]GFH35293.1 hypothetical protein SCWH03_15080 [Streptomyces pacificus]
MPAALGAAFPAGGGTGPAVAPEAVPHDAADGLHPGTVTGPYGAGRRGAVAMPFAAAPRPAACGAPTPLCTMPPHLLGGCPGFFGAAPLRPAAVEALPEVPRARPARPAGWTPPCTARGGAFRRPVTGRAV